MLNQTEQRNLDHDDGEKRSYSPQGGPNDHIHGQPTNNPDVLKPDQPLPVFDPVPIQIAPDYIPSPFSGNVPKPQPVDQTPSSRR
jgi:hypothetical protein